MVRKDGVALPGHRGEGFGPVCRSWRCCSGIRWCARVIEAVEPVEDDGGERLVTEFEHEFQTVAALWAWGAGVGIGLRGFGRFALEGVTGGFEGALAAAIGEDAEVQAISCTRLPALNEAASQQFAERRLADRSDQNVGWLFLVPCFLAWVSRCEVRPRSGVFGGLGCGGLLTDRIGSDWCGLDGGQAGAAPRADPISLAADGLPPAKPLRCPGPLPRGGRHSGAS